MLLHFSSFGTDQETASFGTLPKSKSHCDWQSVNQTVSLLGLMTRYLFPFDSYDIFLWGVFSDERTGLSFVYAAGNFQRSLPRVRVSPWDIIKGLYRILPESRYIASEPTAQKTPFYCWNVFTESWHCNGRGADRIETSHVIHSQPVHWCDACCSATSNKHSHF
jgi:hypothetical protein